MYFAQLLKVMLSRYNGNKVIGIGISISGMVNHQTGKIIFCQILKAGTT